MSFDESVLDDADQLVQRDSGRLLWSLATAGAQVRRAGETLAEFGVDRLRGDGPPRSLLVAVDLPHAGGLITRCSRARTAALPWRGIDLPRWAGPADALLVATADGHSPRLAGLTAQGAQRGLAMAVVAPAGSEVAGAAGRSPVHELARELNPNAARWSLLAPLLQALDALDLCLVPPSLLLEIADALDAQAELCRPSADTFTHAAKSLAVEFAEDVPLIAGAGELAGVAAATVADTLTRFAGIPAVTAVLPDDMATAAGVLRATATAADDDPDDFFRDRVDEPPARSRPRLLVIGDDGAPDDPLLGERSPQALQTDELAARRSAAALHGLAASVGVRSSSVDVPAGQPLARFASATAFGDFTAAYLALGSGLDPSRPAWDADR